MTDAMQSPVEPTSTEPMSAEPALTEQASAESVATESMSVGPTRAEQTLTDIFEPLNEDDVRDGLAKADPLTIRPRISSRVLCVIFGVLFLVASVAVWWLGVRTESGQAYDEMVKESLVDYTPAWFASLIRPIVLASMPTLIISGVLALIGVVFALIRRRWWLLGQMAVFAVLCYAVSWLKRLLPRPFIIQTGATANSAPSGHTIVAAAAVVILLMGVPRVLRAIAAVIGVLWSSFVAFAVVHGQWHRPTDVVMSLLLVTGIALLVLAFTRTSGMDDPGSRFASASIQIVGTVLITAGLLVCLYAAYVIWQVAPGLTTSASWALEGAIASAMMMTVGLASLGFGLVLAFRQLTASPLSRIGVIGAPPAPPTH